jgi:spermidine synthase
MGWFFAFFILSGFCGLVYQIVWLRIAMAAFGVTSPLVSIVLSVFMAGLAAGSWGAGRLTRRLTGTGPAAFLRLYAATELLIGISGIAVAPLLAWGHASLISSSGAAWGSGSYYLASGAWITGALLPFCICMGATFPLAMASIRAAHPGTAPRSFSYLYVANVLGAMAGALGSAFVLIEALGFARTLKVAAAVNALVALTALLVSRKGGAISISSPRPGSTRSTSRRPPLRLALAFLFTTGMVSLALEVVWTRQFVPFEGPVVYAFATTLAVYLAATAVGSQIYRARARGSEGRADPIPWTAAGFLAGTTGLFALLAADPRLPLPHGLLPGAVRVALGIGPFCGVLGFLTPMLVDRTSSGDPDRAGAAYAVNTLGCIVGPLLSGFVLLPAFGERWTSVLLLAPLFAFAAAARPRKRTDEMRSSPLWLPIAAAAVALLLVALTRDFETIYPGRIVRRDHTATVIATGTGLEKSLLINGQGITNLNPITKMMAHLPLALLDRTPENGLVLCLGMGTSFRSMLSWGVSTTVVELVPSVPPLLGFFHADGDAVRRNPLGRIVVDDARRFLERSNEAYDVIAIDPPPPVEAAGSSLLYSSEFYEAARRRLKADGILQQWLPETDPTVASAVARALVQRFPYVRVFRSVDEGGWGMHFLASARPIPVRTAQDMAGRMPAAASRDLVEWGPANEADRQFAIVLAREMPVGSVIDNAPSAPVLTDDRPVNEYYFLRRLLRPATSPLSSPQALQRSPDTGPRTRARTR